MVDAKSEAQKYAQDYVAAYATKELPPELGTAIAAAEIIAGGGTAEDAANVAMQAACTAATSGAGTLACGLLTVDNVSSVSNTIGGFLHKVLIGEPNRNCWYRVWQVYDLVSNTYTELNEQIAKSYDDTRLAMGLPPKDIRMKTWMCFNSDNGFSTCRNTTSVHEFQVAFTHHPDWVPVKSNNYNSDKMRGITLNSPQFSKNNAGQQVLKMTFSSNSPGDCSAGGMNNFNAALLRLYSIRLNAMRESMRPTLKVLTAELEPYLNPRFNFASALNTQALVSQQFIPISQAFKKIVPISDMGLANKAIVSTPIKLFKPSGQSSTSDEGVMQAAKTMLQQNSTVAMVGAAGLLTIIGAAIYASSRKSG